jgi:hypothetical protein
MPKQPVGINFSQGLNTKVDPWQLPVGQFLRLKNSVFDTGGQLKKVDGFGFLSSLPNTTYSYLTTFKENLTAVGGDIAAYEASNQAWISKGKVTPLNLNTLPLIRNNLNQTQCDAVISQNGLLCVVYTELNNATSAYKYAILDAETGQNIVAPTLLPAGTGTVTGSPRVFNLGNFFVIVFTNVITATSHLQYISISTLHPTIVTTAQDIASSYVSATTVSWDGVVFNNNLYLAYNTTAGGQSVKVTYLSEPQAASGSAPQTPTTFAGATATMMSLCVDSTVLTPLVYVNFYDSVSQVGKTAAVDASLNQILAPTQFASAVALLNLASAAQNGSCLIFEEVSNNYSYDSSIPSHFIRGVTVSSTGAVGTPYVVVRSVGLGSKAFIVSGVIYFLAAYQSPFQPTYFLINGSSSLDSAPVVAAKLAYENGGGYLTKGLPIVNVVGTTASFAYLYKDLIQALTTMNTTQQLTTGGVYSQTGINFAYLDFNSDGINTTEIGNNLHLSGGFLGMYDGYLPVEHNFFLWPDSIELSGSGTGGLLTAQQYYYQVVYEWSDNQGNIHRSAPSIPVTVTTTGSTSSVTVNIPTLRLTMKTANPVKIVIYRWSAAQQVYHQLTSITAPLLNSTTSDSVSFVDTVADSSIQGNSIIYTTGGVVEDVNAPATNIMTLFDTRLWMVDAEDQNLLWFSKQVIESTPVEMSDLFTKYVAPNTGTTATTGPITGLAPMDDKLIIFKANSIYYINGAGPDNTGANDQYSQPTFITAVVGCDDQRSIVLMNDGLMFQSNKGIWLLNRGLGVNYLGAAVERYNNSFVNSANNIPKTNQVRQTLDTGETLMFDYYYQQWGTLEGSPALSSTIYNGYHTMITQYGDVVQQTPGIYLNGANPVTMGFTTGWINLAGLQGFERIYYFYLLGKYLSPHKLRIQVSYDYVDTVRQSIIIQPNNYSSAQASPFGEQPSPFGSPVNLEQWKIHLKKQKCQSFQISVDEIFDPQFGTKAGAGLTLSGINMLVLVKKGSRPIRAADTAG